MKYVLFVLSCLFLSGCYSSTTFKVLNRETRVVEYEQRIGTEFYSIKVDSDGVTTFYWDGNNRYVTNPKTQVVEIGP